MERLRDHLGDGDPDRALAARLLASGDVDELTEERAARIERALRRRSRAPARGWWLRPAVLAGVVLGVASVALANSALVRKLIEGWFAAAPAPPVAAAAGSREAGGPEAPAAPQSAPPVAAAAEPLVAARAAPATGVPASPVTTPEAAAPAARPVPARSPDPVAILRRQPRSPETIALGNAVTSLRRDHEPERAAMFLTFYLDRYPKGRFIEEAFALAIEAAQGRHAPDAPLLARRYLQRFPRGRYHALAERVARKEPRRP